jgi:peptide/nickel transport system substrate-binding protein
MLTLFQQAAVYDVLFQDPDLQAYRKARFTGWVRQPAGTGPVIYSNTSPSYARLKLASASAPAGASDDGGGSSTGIIIGVVIAVLALVGGLLLLRRRKTAYDRE